MKRLIKMSYQADSEKALTPRFRLNSRIFQISVISQNAEYKNLRNFFRKVVGVDDNFHSQEYPHDFQGRRFIISHPCIALYGSFKGRLIVI